MDIVISTAAYFRLSCEAVVRYCEKMGIVVYPEETDDGYTEYWLIEPEGRPASDSQEYIDKFEEQHFLTSSIERNDPMLVEVVKELGTKRASDGYSNIVIVTIPEDVDWFIAENDWDGMEWVQERSRSWYYVSPGVVEEY